MPYAKEENLPPEVGQELVRLALRTRFTVKELEEAAQYLLPVAPVSSLAKVIEFCQQTGAHPVPIAALLNELAYEEGRVS